MQHPYLESPSLHLVQQHLAAFAERHYGDALHAAQIHPLRGGLQATGVFRNIWPSLCRLEAGNQRPTKDSDMKETILVCVSHPTHAEKLIQHGLCLVHAFHGRGLILNVHPTPYDALDYNAWQTQHLFRTLAEKYALPLFERVSPTSAAADVIVATINEQSVTQVVLGQTAQNRLEAMFGNSMVNQLLKKATGVAIHIVAVNRVDRSGMAFDKGLNAWLSEYDESSYGLCFEKPAHPTTGGVFFKRAATDFEHGYFVTAGKDGQPNVFPVVNGKVSSEDWTKKTLSQISFVPRGLGLLIRER